MRVTTQPSDGDRSRHALGWNRAGRRTVLRRGSQLCWRTWELGRFYLARSSMLGVTLLLAAQTPSLVLAQPAAPQPLVIGVDHADPANQQPERGRNFEYTDFFSRDASVHSGDTVTSASHRAASM